MSGGMRGAPGSALDWYDSTRSRRPRGRAPKWIIITLAVVLVLGGGYAVGRVFGFDPTSRSREIVYNLLDDTVVLPEPPAPPEPSPTSAPTQPPDDGDPTDPTPEDFRERYLRLLAENPQVAEGVDFSFFESVNGAPPHWSCAHPIPVVLAGEVPPGAEESFNQIVPQLAEVSGLPLRSERSVAHVPPEASRVTVYYAAEGVAPGSFSAEGDVLGRGGVSYFSTGSSAGMVVVGEVVVRNDTPGFEPTTRLGRDVLAHELMHALAISHSQPDLKEVMMPFAHEQWPELGQGDRLALKIVGCD